MSRSRIRVRGLRLLAIACDDRDAHHLQQQFQRLGVEACFLAHLPGDDAFENTDMVLFDGDSPVLSHPDRELAWPALPRIVLTGVEAPSRLQWIIRQAPSAYLRKPVRFDGVMTALTLARAAADQQQGLQARIERLEERLRIRRFLFSAQLMLMKEFDLGEDDAYALLRSLAMRQQKTVEHFSLDLLARPEGYLRLAKDLLAG
ncbi:ANTAR domain-containing response regulator [Alloalcanivorax marinus]|uniref:ANTAR domain-containing response regulator n=1 Tax=Alloalcanivorax marinus TaxID=1177169 RepID=UPI0021D1CB16|nr:ANTAR domain-containing protein [Alloalcanivorax marinus]